jgi:uncharacterized protein
LSDLDPIGVTSLLDWKRRVFELYSRIRAVPDPTQAWSDWKTTRDELFASHPQSPLPHEDHSTFTGLDYFDYDPRARVLANIQPAAARRYEIATSGDGTYAFSRFATAGFELDRQDVELELYWLEGYGGGLFVSFRDATSGRATYGAGRYLLDTVKGSDLGMEGERLVLDFNFSYNPSCAYDPRWVCPLAPQPNWLRIPIEAGERTYEKGNPA